MNILPLLCLLIEVNIFSVTSLPPVPPNDFLKTLATKCPLITENNLQTLVMRRGGFEKCRNWTEVDNTKHISRDTEENARCLLFSDSFVFFCKESAAKIEKLDTLVPDLEIYKVGNFCENWKLFPFQKFEHNVSQHIITNELNCKKLCITYENTIYTECSLAYYFANLNITIPVSQEKTHLKIEETAGVAQNGVVQPAATQGNETVNALITKKDHKALNSGPHSGNSLTQNAQPKQGKEDESELGEIEPPPPPEAQPAANTVDSPVKTVVAQKGKNTITSVVSDQSGKNAAGPLVIETKAGEGAGLVTHEDNSLDGKKKVETSVKDHNQNQVETDSKVSVDVHQEDSAIHVSQDETFNSNPDDADADEGDNDDAGEPLKDGPGNEKLEEVIDDKVEQNKDMKIEGETEDDQRDKLADDDKEEQIKGKPDTVESSIVNENTEDLTGDSYFFSYFMVISVLFILGYVGYHNRQKVLALVLEGKRGKRQYRGRRPNSANYHKLDSNLEEAISSTCTKNASHVIY